MRTLKLYILFALTACLTALYGQPCLGTVSLNGKSVCIQAITEIPAPVSSAVLKLENPRRGDVIAFDKYFHPGSYANFKNQFLASDWFGLSESDYDAWQTYLSAGEIMIEDIVSFESTGIRYACFQYYIIADGVYDRASLLFKNVNNFWYPTSEGEDLDLAYERGFFRSVRPQLLKYLIDEQPVNDQRTQGRAFEIRQHSVVGNTVNAEAVLRDRAAISSIFSDEYQTLYYNLEERVDPDMWYNADRQKDVAFSEYLDSLQMPMQKQADVLNAIKNFHYLKAAVRIAQYQGGDILTPVYVDAIRRIYGEDKIVEITATPDHE